MVPLARSTYRSRRSAGERSFELRIFSVAGRRFQAASGFRPRRGADIAGDRGKRLASEGVDAVGSTPDAFASVIRTDIVKWGEVVRASGAKVDLGLLTDDDAAEVTK